MFAWLIACAHTAERPPFDWLAEPVPGPSPALLGEPITPATHEALRAFGERWFRDGGYGSERAVTDVMGILMGTLEAPCDTGTCPVPVLPLVARAIDDLDGVAGNLFTGNGGPDGPGATSDLVLALPPGATVHGVPLPERVSTGLDVEAGEAWPIGVVPVPAPAEDQGKPWLVEPSKLADPPLEGAPAGSFRLRLSCAACHYSLDVDHDGVRDLASAREDRPTPGSPYRPEHAWTPGNTDLSFGVLFALSANPLLGAVVISGDPDAHTAPADGWATWLREAARTDLEAALHAVVRGMLVQPRGWADVTPNGRYDTMQIPGLLTRGHWPANTNGAFAAPEDRNNVVWTGALDFTGSLGLCNQPKGRRKDTFFEAFTAEEYAELITVASPVARTGTADDLARLRADVVGTSDGVPGLLGPDGVVVIRNPIIGTLSKDVYRVAKDAGLDRRPRDLGRDARWRRFTLAALGTRIGFPSEVEGDPAIVAAVREAPELHREELVSGALSLFLDTLDPAPNDTALLRDAVDRVPAGAAVFVEAGCARCHGGPFLTDNLVHPVAEDGYGKGEPVGTEPQRADSARGIRVVSAPYDPETGLATGPGGPIRGLFRHPAIGYKSTTLRGVWQTAPYLHDGGVAVAPGAPPSDDLRTRLAAGDLVYGAGAITQRTEQDPTFRPDAALSLQALVLASERAKVVAANRTPTIPVPPPGARRPSSGAVVERLSMADVGVSGEGHAYWVDDVPGGDRVTALVAFLLALDDCPRDLPGGPASLACPRAW